MPGLTTTGSVHRRDLSVDVEDVRAGEMRAANAWPASQMTSLHGWALRHSPGVPNRRANSVLPLQYDETTALIKSVEAVERFYAARDLPSRFMVSPAASPENLDGCLEQLGYHIDAPTWVQWSDPSAVLSVCAANQQVELLNSPTPQWMATYMEGVLDQQEIDLKTDLIERINQAHVLAQIVEQGQTVAVGLGVCERGWAGIFCMHTRLEHRRKGLARDILGSLAGWARDVGAEKMYLQVENDNPVAQQFYEASGFVTEYGYHYRTKETARASQ